MSRARTGSSAETGIIELFMAYYGWLTVANKGLGVVEMHLDMVWTVSRVNLIQVKTCGMETRYGIIRAVEKGIRLRLSSGHASRVYKLENESYRVEHSEASIVDLIGKGPRR